MNKIHLHEQEILEKFEKKYADYIGCAYEESEDANLGEEMLKDISDALHSQVEVIKKEMERKRDEIYNSTSVSYQDKIHYSVFMDSILALLTIHEDKTP